MKNERFLELMNNIDEELLLRAEADEKIIQKHKINWLKWGAIAACFVLIIAASIIAPLIFKDPPVSPPSPQEEFVPPVYESAIFSAQEIGELFYSGDKNGAQTNAYTKVYVERGEYLSLNSVNQPQYLSIYQRNNPLMKKNRSRTELRDFIDTILNNLGSPYSELDYKIGPDYLSSYLDATIQSDLYLIHADQTKTCNYIRLTPSSSKKKLVLNGKRINIDQNQSDSEIIESLSEVKEDLFQLFGVSFSDIKIIRYYDNLQKRGASSIGIFFYNESDLPLNSYFHHPLSNYILLHFYNDSDEWEDEIQSDLILNRASIGYVQNRADLSQAYRESARVKAITLQEAEELLYKGYVFGNSCYGSMEAQEKVSFEDYDYVELTYIFDMRENEKTTDLGVPFYAFYKKIGTAQNGNEIYAITYVPAIPIDGLDAYFQEQIAYHSNHS